MSCLYVHYKREVAFPKTLAALIITLYFLRFAWFNKSAFSRIYAEGFTIKGISYAGFPSWSAQHYSHLPGTLFDSPRVDSARQRGRTYWSFGRHRRLQSLWLAGRRSIYPLDNLRRCHLALLDHVAGESRTVICLRSPRQ